MSDKIVVIDGNNLLVRAMFAVKASHSVMSADGVPTGALLVFVNTLSRHVREERPDRLVVAWDSGSGTSWRKQRSSTYKAHRLQAPSPEESVLERDSFHLAKEFLSLAGVHHVEAAGYEADDIIAEIVRQAPEPKNVVIVSSDKDFKQLLQPGVEQVRVSSAGTPTDRWTHETVREVDGCEPEHMPYVMALMGDKSDGVIGLKGIGPKKAIKMLKEASWSLQKICEDLPEEDAVLVVDNLVLVDLRNLPVSVPVRPVPPFQPTGPGRVLYQDLLLFLDRYALMSVRERLRVGTLWT